MTAHNGADAASSGSSYGGKITAAVVVTCIVAASGGLIFGYDVGISGIYIHTYE